MTALSAPTFTHMDALVTFATGILLPSSDVVSDIGLSIKLLNTTCYERFDNCNKNSVMYSYYKSEIEIQHLFGWIIWIPIIINLLFTFPHFLRVEKTWKQRLLTFPFLICQCWSQYRSLRVLWFAYVPSNITKCLAEKQDLEQTVYNLGKKQKLANLNYKVNVSFLEPFLEAAPQVHITFILLGKDGFWYADPLLKTSFAISIFASVFGIAKLLKNGSIKMVRKNGKVGGYGTPGFILLMVIVACNMLGKAIWIALAFNEEVFDTYNTFKMVWIWALACLMPQFLLVNSQLFV